MRALVEEAKLFAISLLPPVVLTWINTYYICFWHIFITNNIFMFGVASMKCPFIFKLAMYMYPELSIVDISDSEMSGMKFSLKYSISAWTLPQIQINF